MLADSIRALVDEFNAAANRDAWQAATRYELAQRRVSDGRYWDCTVAGTSASGTGPEFTTAGATVVDGTVSWKEAGEATGTHTAPIPSFLGERFEAEHGQPPRLVWIPSEDTFGPPVRIGANPKSTRTRNAGTACHVWGADIAATEQLVNDLIYAAHESQQHAWYSAEHGHWETKGELTNQGIVYVLEMIFQIPVVGPTPATVKPTTYTTTTSINPVPS